MQLSVEFRRSALSKEERCTGSADSRVAGAVINAKKMVKGLEWSQQKPTGYQVTARNTCPIALLYLY